MRYAESRLKKELRDETYRIYMSDSIYYATRQKAMNDRYADIVDKRNKRYDISGDELALAVIRAAGIEYVDDRPDPPTEQ